MKQKIISLGLFVCILCILTGCSRKSEEEAKKEKIFRYGTTAYGPEMGNAGLNPHENYSGWSTIRYGVGETLFQFDESMRLTPWLAVDYEQIDEYTIKINLRENVYFTSGRKMDGEAVKECLEDLIAKHDQAPSDLQIETILAKGQTITLQSKEKVPALLNYLCDPYAAIIDMEYGVTQDKNVAGTGPFVAKKVSDQEIELEKNTKYWGGEVKMDKVIVKSITDGDTLAMALQSGEIDAAQGLPYASLSLFVDNQKYKISSTDTSRTFFAAMNFKTKELQDKNVRKAIAMGIDKEGFTNVLLNGNGTKAKGPFPASFTFGDNEVSALDYEPEKAKALLAEAGWKDMDLDGYVEKDGEKLTIRWLTYPGRQELPLLAEAAQATLKDIGIAVVVNSTANHMDFIESGDWDVYASAFVTAPTGDPAYFFTTHTLKDSAKNRGQYYNETLEGLAKQLKVEFDVTKRSNLAIQMQRTILEDAAFFFASHLRMSFVMKNSVIGFEAHPSDYYEITANLDIE